jgi:hypothetical protein
VLTATTTPAGAAVPVAPTKASKVVATAPTEKAPSSDSAKSLSPAQSTTATTTKITAATAGIVEIPNEKEGFRKPAQYYSDTYLRRGKELSAEQGRQLTAQWGAWTLSTTTASVSRPRPPTHDFPNSDVSYDQFPAGSWQTDRDYLATWLPEGIALTKRAMRALLAEYGHDNGDDDFMYNLTLYSDRPPGGKTRYDFKHPPGNAGYADATVFLPALRKRILHSIVTQSTFTFTMGGHSASAGHGNQFQQVRYGGWMVRWQKRSDAYELAVLSGSMYVTDCCSYMFCFVVRIIGGYRATPCRSSVY